MTSSGTVVKSVAKKLKYYFEVRRLEDGFDLSDSHAPVLDHPPLKARPTLQYDGLHDRALKHYFSQPEVRVQLTQFGTETQTQNPREQHIKKSLQRHMKRYHYLKSTIPACYYVYTNAGMKVHPHLVGYGAAPKTQKKKALKGGWPVLRTTPPTNINRGEAERLVNSATKLLAATTEWDLVHKKDPTCFVSEVDSRPKPRQGSGKRRPLTAKYTWDIHGHRVPSAKVKAYDDSYIGRAPRRSYLIQRETSPTPTSSTTTEETAKPPPRQPRPPSPPPPAPPAKLERPKSPKHRQRTVINMPAEQIREEVKVTRAVSPSKYEVGSQTERQLLDDYDHMEDEVKEGPWGEYQVYVTTGNRTGASTSADVKLTIYGEKGRTPAIALSNSKYNKVKFQRGKEDLFIVAARHVGKMRKIKIGHDRSQLNYAWFLEKVTMYDMNDKRIYDFPCERWLSGQDDDHRTYRMLPVDRERAFVDALEKSEERPPSRDGPRNKPASHTSDSESDSTRTPSRKKDRDAKKELGKKEKDDFYDTKPPGTVIQFQKKGSEKVEEEVFLDERGRDRKPVSPEKEYLAGYKAGLEAVEAQEKKRKEEERTHERQLLTGPTIHEAVSSGNLERVRELLDTFPEMKDFKDDSGWTPLHLAAANGHVEIIKWLTSSGRDDLDVETPTGYTPTHVAAMNGHINALMVLNAMGADITSKTVDKQTPLHLAARAGQLHCVKWLVANVADINIQDSFGRTPLYLANEYAQDAVADFLRVCERDLKDPNSSFSQMHRASQRGGSVALPTIKEDDKGSTTSDRPEVDSTSSSVARKRSKAHEEELQQRRQMYEKQHQQMEKKHMSFLDSIRQDVDADAV
ncbi:hypothetical protein BaRGS_00000983 [Batillaria attramentaria]|uniref:PLAT domain-containing protein n=1 Tax=Batillaria attramentaria TaxID=370345 RepID=A0ABD0M958_9CAEN